MPFFDVHDVDKITREDVQRFDAELEDKRLAPKSRAHALGMSHSLIEFTLAEGWATGENPVKRVPKPVKRNADADVHFLDVEEVEALLRAVPDDDLGRAERVMYLTVAMTGMRQGELLGLRWRDVDWEAARVRVRRNFVRGEFGTPKSKRSSRAVRSRPASPPNGSALPELAISGRRRPRLRASGDREADRPLAIVEAIQDGGRAGERRPVRRREERARRGGAEAADALP